MVHHVLERSWGISQAKIHNHGLVDAVLCLERCFVLVPILDAHFIEASFYIKLGEDEHISYFCDQFGYERKRVPISDCPFIDPPVVLHRSLRSVSFPEEEG